MRFESCAVSSRNSHFTDLLFCSGRQVSGSQKINLRNPSPNHALIPQSVAAAQLHESRLCLTDQVQSCTKFRRQRLFRALVRSNPETIALKRLIQHHNNGEWLRLDKASYLTQPPEARYFFGSWKGIGTTVHARTSLSLSTIRAAPNSACATLTIAKAMFFSSLGE
jgi:hypothetical protein